MTLAGLSEREKRMAIICVIVIVLCIGYLFLFRPTIEKWLVLGDSIKEAHANLVRMETALSLSERIDKEYKEHARQIARKGTDEEELSALLQEIDALTSPLNLDIRTVAPRPIDDRQFYKKYAVRVELDATIINLARFLHALEGSPKLLKMESLKISAIDDTGLLRSSLLISRVAASAGEKEDVEEKI